MIDNIFNGFLLVVAAFIDSFLGECGSDHIQFTEVPAAVAILTAAIFLVMVHEVVFCEMLCCLIKGIVLSLALLFVVFLIMCLGCMV